MNEYLFIFSQHFDRDKGLDMGRLSLNHLSQGTIDIWVVTTSVANKQQPESFHQRGGMLPPQYRCPDLKRWEVSLKCIPLPQVKGVEGNFYPLFPYSVTTDRGILRSDFGIHLDANIPGSMGCIVMGKERFASFEKRALQLKDQGIFTIPLFVQYS